MPLTKEHKAESRAKILSAAGKLFRRHGFDGVGIDAIMAAAGLTRGGFYAHFSSKADLFSTVLSNNHDMIKRLAARSGDSPAELQLSGKEILAAYLDPRNFGKVAPNCTFASLSSDASRTDNVGRSGYTIALKTYHDEIKRGFTEKGQTRYDSRALRIMTHTIGAMTLARSSNDAEFATSVLRSAQEQIVEWLTVGAQDE